MSHPFDPGGFQEADFNDDVYGFFIELQETLRFVINFRRHASVCIWNPPKNGCACGYTKAKELLERIEKWTKSL